MKFVNDGPGWVSLTCGGPYLTTSQITLEPGGTATIVLQPGMVAEARWVHVDDADEIQRLALNVQRDQERIAELRRRIREAAAR